VGLEPTIPEFEQAKTVHALDCAAAVAGHIFNYLIQNAFGLSFVVYFEGRI
jgi:hypothetical protein